MDNSSSSIQLDIHRRFLEMDRLDRISNTIHTTNKINMIKQLILDLLECRNHRTLSLEIRCIRSKKNIEVVKMENRLEKTQTLAL